MKTRFKTHILLTHYDCSALRCFFFFCFVLFCFFCKYNTDLWCTRSVTIIVVENGLSSQVKIYSTMWNADKAICIPHSANSLEKYMNSSILPIYYALKSGYGDLSRRRKTLNLSQLYSTKLLTLCLVLVVAKEFAKFIHIKKLINTL